MAKLFIGFLLGALVSAIVFQLLPKGDVITTVNGIRMLPLNPNVHCFEHPRMQNPPKCFNIHGEINR